ncbi:MAG: 3-dehydroquinate synthase [Actinobacteria bacterium]|nr:3-dehydroquinate synthase [Actinomycetota bacterium]
MIVLVGFMGAGKSTVGELLAEELGLPFVDTDNLVQKRAGATIPGIFASGGEEAFRSLEREVVAEVLGGHRSVVALGGGAVNDQETRSDLLDALVLYLDTSYGAVNERLGAAADRPMLQLEDPLELFQARHRMYRSAADIVIETDDKDPKHVAMEAAAMAELFESTHLTRVWASVGEEGYPVYVGTDLMARVEYFLPPFDGAELAYVITHPSLAQLSVPVAAALESRGLAAHVGAVPEGESSKSIAAAAVLFDELAKAGAHRSDVVIGVGGGVVTDLAGFVASTYHRGMPVVQVPTSLLGQVDAAVGGKTGVNLEHGKNLVGTIHQPATVICDVRLLQTLPEAELRAGLAEVIKYGFIARPEILDLVAINVDAIFERDEATLSAIVARSVAIKSDIVSRDERELGVRAHLNYGHTFAHAIEHAGWSEGSEGVRHGEAVALGMMAAAHLARELGMIDDGVVDLHRRILDRVGLPTSATLDIHALERAWRHDKKYQGGVRFVLLNGVGAPEAGVRASSAAIATALERMAE